MLDHHQNISPCSIGLLQSPKSVTATRNHSPPCKRKPTFCSHSMKVVGLHPVRRNIKDSQSDSIIQKSPYLKIHCLPSSLAYRYMIMGSTPILDIHLLLHSLLFWLAKHQRILSLEKTLLSCKHATGFPYKL